MAASSATKTGDHHPNFRHAHAAIAFEPLQDGDAGTIQSLEAMVRAVKGQIAPDFSGFSDPYNKALAQRIVVNSDPVTALFRFVRDGLRYVEHPINMQVVKDCRRLVESGEGDCVSKSVCLATLLTVYGFTPRFVAQDPDGRGFNHVYVEVEVYTPGDWVALDATADGKDGRPLGDVGWRQALPTEGVELVQPIF